MPIIPRAENGALDGVELTPEAVNGTRDELRRLRDAALVQDSWEWATLLSHVISYMAELRERLTEEVN